MEKHRAHVSKGRHDTERLQPLELGGTDSELEAEDAIVIYVTTVACTTRPEMGRP